MRWLQLYGDFRSLIQDVEANIQNVQERRRQLYDLIDASHFSKWIVFVAGIGFFTDAYDIFAVNSALISLQLAYPKLQTYDTQTALLSATLVGTIFGQVIFGVLSDRLGRRNVYGLELIMLLLSTVATAMCSKGAADSMSMFGLLIFWRFFMGMGIGGGYPIAAIMTSEFAPKQHRARMLAGVFCFQALGQLGADIMTLIVTAITGPQLDCPYVIPSATPPPEDCLRAIDQHWRWIMGLGAVPALIAVLLRLTIPESPRWTYEVERVDIHMQEVDDFYEIGNEEPEVFEPQKHQNSMQERAQVTKSRNFRPSDAGLFDSVTWISSSNRNLSSDGSNNTTRAANSLSGADERYQQSSTTWVTEPHTLSHSPGTVFSSLNQQNRPRASFSSRAPPSPFSDSSWQQKSFSTEVWGPRRPYQSSNGLNSPLSNVESNFFSYIFSNRNWCLLFGTAGSWLLLNSCYSGLGLHTSAMVQVIWPLQGQPSIYEYIFNTSLRSLVLSTAGSLLGSLIMVKLAKHISTRSIQLWGGFILGGVLLILAALLYTANGASPLTGALIFFILSEIAFNLGPNATTFMIPAELFSTKWRGTCYGISAAAGKFGSILAHVSIASSEGWKISNSTDMHSQGSAFFAFGTLMLLGVVLTYFFVPDTRDENNRPMTLEDLSIGYYNFRRIRKEKHVK